MMTGLLTIVIVLSLPSARRSQAGFNASIIRAHKIAAGAVRRGQ